MMIELLREGKRLREIARSVAFSEQEFGDCDSFGCNLFRTLTALLQMNFEH